MKKKLKINITKDKGNPSDMFQEKIEYSSNSPVRAFRAPLETYYKNKNSYIKNRKP